MASFFVIRGNDQGTKFEIKSDHLEIGREAGNEIQFHDSEVSRSHAELIREGQRYFLRDLGSSNGTFVNGTRITRHELASGDQVQMGKTLVLFTSASDRSSTRLLDNIDIVSRDQPGENSRILRSMSQAEGSQLLGLGGETQGTETSWLARARSNLQVMYRTALAVSHTLDIDQLLERILQLIFDWVEADRGCIMLVHPDSGKLQPKVHFNRRGKPSGDKLIISQTILDYVMQHNEGVLTSNAQDDERWNPAASILQLGIREALCVPMQARYDVVGVIYIDTAVPAQRLAQKPSAGGGNKFTDEHLKLLIAVAHQAALAVEDTRYYSAMVQAERLAAIGQTIASLSHHIKNVLQGIRGASFLIQDGLQRHDEAEIRQGWEMMERKQQLISEMVMDMLTFSKEREPEMLPAEMNEVVGDVVELMQSRAAEKKVQLGWLPDLAMPTLTFDSDGIHRSVLNVVTNAIDACEETEPHGLVRVSTEFLPDQKLVRVVVTDNGTGIDPDEIDNIFSLFVSTKHSRGTGLGLSVSQKILKEHGGIIRVESEVGRGSTFTLELPAVPPEANSAGDSRVTQNNIGG